MTHEDVVAWAWTLKRFGDGPETLLAMSRFDDYRDGRRMHVFTHAWAGCPHCLSAVGMGDSEMNELREFIVAALSDNVVFL